MKILKRISKGILALLILLGVASSNGQQNMYALASSNNRKDKKSTRVTKKKPKRKPKANGNKHSKSWQHKELAAKKWIIKTESGGRWNVLSYGGRCIGRYQLDPRYLGKKNGHINLDHKHQDQVAEKYVHNRYGSWQAAKRFHIIHHYY